MITISLCMIVKNEEKTLDKCLKSIKDVVDEIIVVDTGSIDKTKEIAQKYTNKIYDYKWNDDFASARNYSLEKATCEYIMWLDADDYVKKSQIKKIITLKNETNRYDMYYFLYDFDNNYQPFYRERIFVNNANYRFQGKIHEAIVPHGQIKYVDIVINQQNIKKGLTNRNLNIFEKIPKNEFTIRDYYYYARELYRHNKISKAIDMFNKFLSFNDGYVENKIDSLFLLGNIYKSQNNYNKSLEMYLKTFIFDTPRANVLCELANLYLINNDLNKAIYYYKLALKIPQKSNNGFIHKDYFRYIPAIQLCICFDKLKNYKESFRYNELAYKYRKNKEIYEINKKYLLKRMLETLSD